ncbi:hypothetical protein [Moraxella oblonga]|uniref:hypothetical protein n=1 Tax=Moraxella oblonga TaxID=200413 RepID=UPI00083718B3|nr:hypothetical protein [Moraxella oblonga]
MKKLILSALISTVLCSNLAFAETYFECTDTDNNHISLKDNGDLVRYHFKNSDGETYFDMQKDSIVAKTEYLDNTQEQYAEFFGDNVHYYLGHTKFTNGKEETYLEITMTDEFGNIKEIHQCNQELPILNSLNLLSNF